MCSLLQIILSVQPTKPAWSSHLAPKKLTTSLECSTHTTKPNPDRLITMRAFLSSYLIASRHVNTKPFYCSLNLSLLMIILWGANWIIDTPLLDLQSGNRVTVTATSFRLRIWHKSTQLQTNQGYCNCKKKMVCRARKQWRKFSLLQLVRAWKER